MIVGPRSKHRKGEPRPTFSSISAAYAKSKEPPSISRVMPDAPNPTRRTRPTFKSLAAALSGQGNSGLNEGSFPARPDIADMPGSSAAAPQCGINAAAKTASDTADTAPVDTADTAPVDTADIAPVDTAEPGTNESLSVAGVKFAGSGIVVPTLGMSSGVDENGAYISPETSAEIQAEVLFPMLRPIDFLNNS